MRILEVGRNVKQVSEVKLGDELELRIDVNHPYSKYLHIIYNPFIQLTLLLFITLHFIYII